MIAIAGKSGKKWKKYVLQVTDVALTTQRIGKDIRASS